LLSGTEKVIAKECSQGEGQLTVTARDFALHVCDTEFIAAVCTKRSVSFCVLLQALLAAVVGV
jgi:hypothetical protein